MKNTLDPNAPILLGIGKLADLVLLSLLWTLCSLPVFTVGPASAALYDCAVRCVRHDRYDAVCARFFQVFRANFRQGALAALLWLAVGAVYVVGLGVVLAQAEAGVAVMRWARYVYAAVGLLPAGAACWLFPLLSRYSFSLKSLSLTAVQMAIAHWPSTLGLLLLTALCALLSAFYLFPLLILPGLHALLASLLIERAFERHQSGDS